MVSSLTFWMVLLLAIVGCWAIPFRFRFSFVAIVSFVFLLTIDPAHVLTLLGASIAVYFLARVARKPQWAWLLAVMICGIVAYLAYYKYLPPLANFLSGEVHFEQLIVPLGISYFTFKLIHYADEIARGNLPEHSLSQLIAYIFFFPIFSAGPIERFDHFLDKVEPRLTRSAIAEGGMRIVYGLIKKFIIADFLLESMIADLPSRQRLVEHLGSLNELAVWGICGFTFLRLYMDFSAYSDIAIGASRLLGFRIAENFNFPVFAGNISNFWKRWHMSLSNFTQTYVYMPILGTTRKPILAVFIAFVVIGIWHDASLAFLCWGLYHATGVIVYQSWARAKRRYGWTFTQHPAIAWTGHPLTMMFVIGSFAFGVASTHGTIYDGFRVLGKLVFLDLPAWT